MKENNKYYYKISLDSERGKKIQSFLDKGRAAAEAADVLAKDLGAHERTDRPGCLYPGVGIGSLVFYAWPGGKRYIPIGANEYVPNIDRTQGKNIAKRIKQLPDVTAMDFQVAFGIPVHQNMTPAWYVWEQSVYLRSSYRLGEEYTIITNDEFEAKRQEVQF